MQENAECLGIQCRSPEDIPTCFSELIRGVHAATGQRVVVLIDEYDKPTLDNITDPDMARQMRDGLRNFYSVIKDSDAHIRLAFLTGVSKFSKVSLFSGLNNLRDITVSPAYSAVCGYTESDVDTVLLPNWKGWTFSRSATGTAATTGPVKRSTTRLTFFCYLRKDSFVSTGSRPARRRLWWMC